MADSVQHICIHQSHGAAGGAGTLASWAAWEASSTPPANHLWDQCKVSWCAYTLTPARHFCHGFMKLFLTWTNISFYVLNMILWHDSDINWVFGIFVINVIKCNMINVVYLLISLINSIQWVCVCLCVCLSAKTVGVVRFLLGSYVDRELSFGRVCISRSCFRQFSVTRYGCKPVCRG